MPKLDLTTVAISEARWLYANPVDRFRTELARWQHIWRRRKHAETHELSHKVEVLIATRLRWAGWQVEYTSHKCPFDLWLDGRVRVEVKGARVGADGRYQCRVHNGQCDYLILLALGRRPVFFIIPARALGRRSTIKLPANLATYNGKWAAYRENWQQLLEVKR